MERSKWRYVRIGIWMHKAARSYVRDAAWMVIIHRWRSYVEVYGTW